MNSSGGPTRRWLTVVRIECRRQCKDLEKDSTVPDIAFDLRYLRYSLTKIRPYEQNFNGIIGRDDRIWTCDP